MIDQWQELGGVPLHHLDKYCRLLNDLADNDKSYDNTDIIDAVELAAKPFLKKHSSDEINTLSLAAQVFTQIAYLLHVDSARVQKTICASINLFFRHKDKGSVQGSPKSENVQVYQPVSARFCQSAIRQSHVLETILETLCEVSEEDHIMCRLQVVHTFMENSVDSSRNLSEELALKLFKISSQLLGQSYQSIRGEHVDFKIKSKNFEIVAIINDILFEALLCGSTAQNTFKPTPESENGDRIESFKEEIITSLFNIFLEFTNCGVLEFGICASTKTRKRRNDILVLLNILVESNATYFISTGIVESLLKFSLIPENPLTLNMVQNSASKSSPLKLTNTTEDFQLKKLMWLFINKIAAIPAALRTISDSGILENFFQFIHLDYSQKPSAKMPWTVAQKYELEQLALDCLCSLTPVLLEDFVECHGVTRIIMFLDSCLNASPEEIFIAQSLKSTLRVIRQIVVLDCEPINTEFVDQGLIQLILTELQERKGVALKVDLEIKQDLLFILSVLCEYQIERKDILGRDGIMLFIEYLNTCVNGLHISNQSQSSTAVPSYEQILIVYVVDCIWSCVCSALTVEKMFIEQSGVYLLLDALERATAPIYPILLGTLCEFCDNDAALEHVVAWKSSIDGVTNSRELFLNMWNNVEGGKACYANTSKASTRNVIDEIFETPHAKIFTLCQKLEGHSFDKPLSKRHQITLVYVKRYFDLKTHDAWCEVDRQLREEDHVKPIPIDDEFLNSTYAERNVKMANLLAEEQSLEKEQDEETRQEELCAYERTNTAYFGMEAKHKRWQKKLMLTSNHEQLQSEAGHRLDTLKSSRAKQQGRTKSTNIVHHELIFPLKNSTTNHAKVLTIDS